MQPKAVETQAKEAPLLGGLEKERREAEDLARIMGEGLDFNKIMRSPEGKPRQSIFYLAHLEESQRMFFLFSWSLRTRQMGM